MFKHRYFPHTDADVSAMLDKIGATGLNDIFADIPAELRLADKGYSLPEEMSEHQVREYFESLNSQNRRLVCFAGSGFYDHYTPSVVSALASRSEFLTS